MRVVFYAYPSAFQNPGGGEIQLLKTKEALQRKGVEVKLFNQWQDSFDDFDILHVFGSVKDCLGLMHSAKNKGLKIALSTIFWSSFKRSFFESARIKTRAELALRHLTKLLVPVFPSGRRKMMALADILLPNSRAEVVQLKRLFALPERKMQVVANGVDEWFKNARKDIFVAKFGLSDFVLAVGRIEPRKNQLNLIKALSDFDKELVIIGNPVSDYQDYYRTCKKEAGRRVHFLGGMAQDDPLLASAYTACAVFVSPGWFETPGLAALEAGLAGAKLAVTKYGCTREYFLDLVEYFDPSNIKDIRRAIAAELKTDTSRRLQEHILYHYTWDKVAESTLAAYTKILKER